MTEIDTETPPVLSIGALYGGTTEGVRRWKALINPLRERVIALVDTGVQSTVHVNVVYQVPGEILGVDFSGVRTGRYSSKDRHLLVQAAVPREVPEDAEALLIALLRDSIAEATAFAKHRRIANDLPELRELIAQL